MRSGWKTSSWSSFSPTDANFTGRPVTALTESAAPPRASPSSFVSTTPSNAIRSWNATRDRDRLLPRHRVDDEEDVHRLHRVADVRELVHQRLVDLEPAGGVHDHHIAAVGRGARETLPRRDDGVARLGPVDRHLDLPAELLQLVDRRRPLEICGDETRRLSLVLAEMERELRGGRRLARALQPAEEDHDRRAAEDELRVARAHQVRELLVDDLHDLLARLEPLEDVLPERALPHRADELLDDLEVDVGLEEREADLARGARDGLLVEAGLAPEVAEGVLEPVRERVEHGPSAYRARLAGPSGHGLDRPRLKRCGRAMHAARRTPTAARFCAGCGAALPAAAGRAPRGTEDRHRPLLRRRRVDVARRGDRPRDDASRHVALRAVDDGDRHARTGDGRAVPRRRGDGRVRRPGGRTRTTHSAPSAPGWRCSDASPSSTPSCRRTWGVELACRIGINTGEVVAGDPGPGEHVRDRRRGQPRQATGAGRRARGDPDRHGDVPAREGRRPGRAARAVHAPRGRARPSTASGSTRSTRRPPATRAASTRRSSAGPTSSTRIGRSPSTCSSSRAAAGSSASPDRQGSESPGSCASSSGGARGRRDVAHAAGASRTEPESRYWPLVELVPTSAGSRLRPSPSTGTDRRRGRSRPPAHRDERQPMPGRPSTEVFWAVRRLLEADLGAARPLLVASRTCTGRSRRCSTSSSTSQSFATGPLVLLCIARPELLEARPSWARFPRSSSGSCPTPRLPSSSSALGVEDAAVRDADHRRPPRATRSSPSSSR